MLILRTTWNNCPLIPSHEGSISWPKYDSNVLSLPLHHLSLLQPILACTSFCFIIQKGIYRQSNPWLRFCSSFCGRDEPIQCLIWPHFRTERIIKDIPSPHLVIHNRCVCLLLLWYSSCPIKDYKTNQLTASESSKRIQQSPRRWSSAAAKIAPIKCVIKWSFVLCNYLPIKYTSTFTILCLFKQQ